MLLTGGLAAVAALTESPYLGLAERLTTATCFQWTFILTLKMYSISHWSFESNDRPR